MTDFSIIIPARMQSTRLANKMLLDIHGVPLCIRVAKQALKTDAKQVVVATDHIDIYNECLKFDIKAVMTNVNHNSGTDRVAEASRLLGLSNNEIVVNIQGDEPLIDPVLVNKLALFIKQKNVKMATVANPIKDFADILNPNIVKTVLDKDDNALYFSRYPLPFYRDGYSISPSGYFCIETTSPDVNVLRHVGLYAYSVEFLQDYVRMPECALEKVECLEQLRVLYNGYKIAVMQANIDVAIGVDTEADLHKVRDIIAIHNQ